MKRLLNHCSPRLLKDIKASEDNLRDGNFDWGLAIAYNAMLSAGRALMALKGLRTE